MGKTVKNDAYWTTQITGVGTFRPEDDLLHPEAKLTEPDATLTESQYFGLCVPDKNIHGALCLYWYPNIGQITGGVWIWEGFKHRYLTSEIFDWRNHMSDKALTTLRDYTLVNGYNMRVVEPGKEFHAKYCDPVRNNSFDIRYTAIMAPFMLGSGNHFVQHMRTEGELLLRGKKYHVDGFTVRNRSWGQARSESNQPLTPVTWMSGVYGPEFSFYCSIYDKPEDHVEWNGQLSVPFGNGFCNGFIRINGQTVELAEGRKRMVRNPLTLFPERVELDLVDRNGKRYSMVGTIVAASGNFGMWYNMDVAVCQTRWECNGQTGYGDVQDIKLGDFLYLAANL